VPHRAPATQASRGRRRPPQPPPVRRGNAPLPQHVSLHACPYLPATPDNPVAWLRQGTGEASSSTGPGRTGASRESAKSGKPFEATHITVRRFGRYAARR